jgi:DNA-binding NtrC family response regulator
MTTAPEGAQGTPETTTLSIITLDDDDDFRQYIRGVLEGDGHACREARGVRELFDLCEQALPDVVLLDMNMGRETGMEVLAQIRQRWTKLCVIVVTGYPTMEGMRQTFKQDIFDYLAKPFSIEDLRKSLRQAVETLGLGQRPHDRLRLELGRQIRMARTEKTWTLKELSEASNVSVSQLSSIERGAHLPSIESMVSIALAMDKRPSDWILAAGL